MNFGIKPLFSSKKSSEPKKKAVKAGFSGLKYPQIQLGTVSKRRIKNNVRSKGFQFPKIGGVTKAKSTGFKYPSFGSFSSRPKPQAEARGRPLFEVATFKEAKQEKQYAKPSSFLSQGARIVGGGAKSFVKQVGEQLSPQAKRDIARGKQYVQQAKELPGRAVAAGTSKAIEVSAAATSKGIQGTAQGVSKGVELSGQAARVAEEKAVQAAQAAKARLEQAQENVLTAHRQAELEKAISSSEGAESAQ